MFFCLAALVAWWPLGRAGVPNKALLKALAANTGAGVSGTSICVVSNMDDKQEACGDLGSEEFVPPSLTALGASSPRLSIQPNMF